jgi:stearoyl-CoA 9-desaturase NADPH oxidoreductase
VWQWRTYSVTSRPGDPRLAVTVTAVPGGTVSGALAHRTPVGALLRIGPPAGEFVLPDPVPEKLLFVTAGSGITPVMGMLRELAATRPGALDGAVVVHCDRTPADVVFGRELRALAASTGLHYVERHTAVRGHAAPAGGNEE